MKPFNLQDALNGAALVTREGKEATGFELGEIPNYMGDYPYRWTVKIGESCFSVNKDGKVFEDYDTTEDLFLAEEPPKIETSKTINMKPFNLQAALAGKPVVTRAGHKVEQIHLFDVDTLYPLRAVVQGTITDYAKNGSYYYSEEKIYELDLFMAEEEMFVAITDEEFANGEMESPIFTDVRLAIEEKASNVRIYKLVAI